MAAKTCDNLGKGKLLDAKNVESVLEMIAIYSEKRKVTSSLWIPYTDGSKEGEWSNFYDGNVASLPWTTGQPNGGATQNCASTSIVNTGYVIDNGCSSYKRRAVCEFKETPSFKLKGLGLHSGIDTMYYVHNTDDLVQYIGYMNTIIRFNSSANHWSMLQEGRQIGEATEQKKRLLLGTYRGHSKVNK